MPLSRQQHTVRADTGARTKGRGMPVNCRAAPADLARKNPRPALDFNGATAPAGPARARPTAVLRKARHEARIAAVHIHYPACAARARHAMPGRLLSAGIDAPCRALLDALPVQVWCDRPDGAAQFRNRKWCDYAGLGAPPAPGETCPESVHPDDLPRYDALRLGLAATLEPGESELRLRRFDGQYRWFLVRVAPAFDAHGKLRNWYGTNTDIDDLKRGVAGGITERKRAQEALAASEQMARGQAEALAQTLAALALDEAPDRLAQHISRTISAQLGAHSNSVWRRNDANGLIGFEFAFEGGKFVSKTDPRIAGIDLWLPMDEALPWPAPLRAGRHCLLEDIRTVPSFDLRDRLVAMGIVTVLMVPVLIAGRLDGVLAIRYAHKRRFRAEEIEFAKALANQAVLAMQLTRLSAESRDSAVLAERNRMARDIHDALAQGLTGVIVQLEAAEDAALRGLSPAAGEHVRRASQLARESLAEARRSVLALRPQALEQSELSEALDAMLAKLTAGTGLRAEFVLLGEPRPLRPEWEENLLRIGQEVLTNALRHARADRISAELAFSPDEVCLAMRDNGCGFDPAGRYDGFGLLGMRERARRMGGRLSVRSAPGEGTAVAVTVPFAAAAESAGA